MDTPALPPHLRNLHDALKAEEAAERDELNGWRTRSHDERVSAQVSFPLLAVETCDRRGRSYEVLLRAPRGVWLHDNIDAGDAIAVRVDGRWLPGRCDGQDGRTCVVRIDEPIGEGTACEVMLRADASTWIRYRQGLERAGELHTPLTEALLHGEVTAGTRQGGTLPGLNPAQQRAADHALRADALALIHGPPGTGKTRVIGALLAEWVKREEQPWALADSNAATDHLARIARALGLDVVRAGAAQRIADDLQPLTLEARIARGPFHRALAVLDKQVSRSTDHRERRQLVRERRALWDQATEQAVESADVVAVTLGSFERLASRVPPGRVAVVDEATQASEPGIWQVTAYVDTLILVGDPEQLGPFSRVPGSPLETSLLDRLLALGVPAPMLTVQHRMDARIRSLVAPVYGPEYVDHPDVAEQALPVQALWGQHPAVWIDTAGAGFDDQRCDLTASLFNPGETRVVVRVVEQLRAEGIASQDIAVIAPYSAQVQRLVEHLPDVDVATVNAFQGQERAVVVVSWVRSNADGDLGFVADGRRLTVSLTRARRALIQVGDSSTLCGHPRFADVVDTVAEAGGLASVFEPPWDDAL